MENVLNQLNKDELYFNVNTKTYSLSAIKEASYRFTNECYIFLENISEDTIKVHIKAKTNINLNALTYSFMNELIEQQIRFDLDQKFGGLRDKIIEKAFSHKKIE
ncbi:MAG: His-Xaa-Ser system protein HxsD [Elusimicrobia bacterium]|nr:His-Xaa-Ser system protein HxsD [Elusimicrobiota bacterium]